MIYIQQNLDRSRVNIDGVVDEYRLPVVREAGFVGEPDIDRIFEVPR